MSEMTLSFIENPTTLQDHWHNAVHHYANAQRVFSSNLAQAEQALATYGPGPRGTNALQVQFLRDDVQAVTRWLDTARSTSTAETMHNVLMKSPWGDPTTYARAVEANARVLHGNASAVADAFRSGAETATRSARQPTMQLARAALGQVQRVNTVAVRQAVAQSGPGVLDKIMALGRSGLQGAQNLWTAGRNNAGAAITAIATALNLTPAGLLRRAAVAALVGAASLVGISIWSDSGSESPARQPPPATEQVEPPAPGPPGVPPVGELPAEPGGGVPAEPPAGVPAPEPAPGEGSLPEPLPGDQGPMPEPVPGPGGEPMPPGEHEQPNVPPANPMPGEHAPGG
jgi:hypothetical protein